jgi:NADH-quinone oxidoreductase subunit N
MSISIYGLILINVPILPKSAETGAKYFLLSILSVALMFGGAKEIYLYTGHLNYIIISNSLFEYFTNFTKYNELYPLKIGILLIMVGFFFKLTAAPMHF